MTRAVVVVVAAGHVELASDRLWTAGAGAVEERVRADGDVELWTHLADDDDVARRRLGHVPDGWAVRFVDVDDAPDEAWRHHAQPVWVTDDLVLVPAWHSAIAAGGVTSVFVEPGGAFGLGDHPTTRLSASAVRRHVRRGDAVLDVGTGSGVLAVIAALLGASTVVAIDVAEPARQAAEANARRNGVGDRVVVSTTPISDVDGGFDLVVANILAPALVAMADELVGRTAHDGLLVVSGVLADRHEHVVAALAPMRPAHTEVLDGWAAIELRHPVSGRAGP